jgi:hypothetical protein
LILAASLFLAWMGWLAYLARTTTNPIVLSRPQFQVSNLDVIAEVGQKDDGPDSEVKVLEVAWASDNQDDALKSQTIHVSNLSEMGKDQGWQGPGRYILPLQKMGFGKPAQYKVAPIPGSPGFPRPKKEGQNRQDSPRIYPATPDAEDQLRVIEGNR